MTDKKNSTNNKGKKSNVKTFLLTALIAFIVSLLVFVGSIFAWFTFRPPVSGGPSGSVDAGDDKTLLEEKMTIPRKTNFLLIGVDKTELLTDVMIVGCFDSKTEEITLISVPRDTLVEMSSELREEAKAEKIHFPNAFKANEINSYAGEKRGIYYLEKYLEELLGVSINYYAEVDTKAFRDIVDAVGGIDMEIRPKGLHYYDPTQNLTIDVPGGMQHLDGKMAEGVVRFRNDYSGGDIQRISVQQEFMQAFFAQVLNKQTIKDNALSIATTCLSYTKTDFPVTDIPRYLPYIGSLSSDNLTTLTLPGAGQYINKVSYYVLNKPEITKIVNAVFYGNGLPKVPEELKDVQIEVLNGSGVEGLGKEMADDMKAVGYNVPSVKNYDGESAYQTVIYKKTELDTTEIEKFFSDTKVAIDENMTSTYDIVIVIGTSEQ